MLKSIELCSIYSIKTGNCSEDCSFCAQRNGTWKANDFVGIPQDEYQFQNILKDVVETSIYNFQNKIKRFSLVASGKRQSPKEMDKICRIYKEISKSSNIKLCASLGLLSYEDLLNLKKAGVTRYHCNLETSREFFSKICTTHTFDEKIETLESAKKAGLEICSGMIIGMGETMEDRINLAKDLKSLKVNSCPINILIPIENTPLEGRILLDTEEIIESIKNISEILGPQRLRLAGGRLQLPKEGGEVFGKYVSSLITGNMLTTKGNQVQKDIALIKDMGLEIDI